MHRFVLLAALLAPLCSVELSGTWAGPQAELPAGATVVLAIYDRNGSCCGGPAAALAGLGNLRTALKDRADIRLIAVDATAGATVEQAVAAAALHRTDGIPLLVDGTRKTAAGLDVTIDMTMAYVVIRGDGTQQVEHNPSRVKQALGL